MDHQGYAVEPVEGKPRAVPRAIDTLKATVSATEDAAVELRRRLDEAGLLREPRPVAEVQADGLTVPAETPFANGIYALDMHVDHTRGVLVDALDRLEV
jgi:hypothetical protein